MTDQGLATTLKLLREELGASTEQIASWSDISTERIAGIEALGKPSIYEFERICHALGLEPSQVLEESAPDPRRSVAWFRSEVGQRLDAADLRLLRTVSEVSENLFFLQQRLGEVSPLRQLRRLQPPSVDQRPWEQGYLLGEDARSKLENPVHPIPDLGTLLNRQGVYIVFAEFSSSRIEAASLWQSNSVPTILLNRKAGKVQYSLARRAVLGHELCHLLHDGGEAEAMARVTFEEGDGYQQQVEQRARAFSPAFLAPRKQAKAWWKRQGQARDLAERILRFAKYWGLSYEGAIWHAKNCRLIAEDVARELNRQESLSETLVTADFESPLPPEIDSPAGLLVQGWAAKLVDRAWNSGVITEGRREELLAWR